MYTATFPLPPSLNQCWSVRSYKKNQKGPKKRALSRSKQYNSWLTEAGKYWRHQYPEHPPLLKGRIRAQYVVRCNDDVPRDIGNYEKIIADYLQGKFYADDNQIDEIHILRRIDRQVKQNVIHAYISEIKDTRYVDMLSPEGTALEKPGIRPDSINPNP